MPVAIPTADLEFLRRVRELGLSGMGCAEIAATVGLSRGGLILKLARMGFELMPANDVRATLTGERLSEMLDRGDIVAREDRQPVEVVG